MDAGNSKKQRGRPWPKGVSGNPTGRPRLPEELRATIAALTEEMILGIADLARTAHSESVRFEAKRYLVDRRLGKPVETTKIDATEGREPPTIIIRDLSMLEKVAPGALPGGKSSGLPAGVGTLG